MLWLDRQETACPSHRIGLGSSLDSCMDLQRIALIETILARPGVAAPVRLILTRWLVEKVHLDEAERAWLIVVDATTRSASRSLDLHSRTLIDTVLARPDITQSLRLVLMKW